MFDVAYRDYMNRFRYFTDEMGRNFTLRVKVPFGKP
jgi:iron complex outermembrane receptor protein